MFKKITYILSVILGMFLVFKLFSKRKASINLKLGPMDSEIPRKIDIKPKRVTQSKLNSRQKDILKLINKRKVLLPADIYALHPDVSTRTLRRDMTSLVQDSLVRQEGSTRDTRYFLID